MLRCLPHTPQNQAVSSPSAHRVPLLPHVVPELGIHDLLQVVIQLQGGAREGRALVDSKTSIGGQRKEKNGQRQETPQSEARAIRARLRSTCEQGHQATNEYSQHCTALKPTSFSLVMRSCSMLP